MSGPRSARLAAASPGFVREATATELADWHGYFDPDAVLLTGAAGDDTMATRRARDTLRRHTDPDLPQFAGADGDSVTGPRRIDGVQFVFAPSTDALASIGTPEGDELDTGEPTFVVSDLLGLSVDTTALSAELLGREAYVDALDPARLEGEYVHLSTRLPAGYRREWDDLTVVGAGADAGVAGNPLVALDCGVDGRVLAHDLKPSRLGLRALDGVGPARAGRLREAGVRDPAAVAGADLSQLAEIGGLGGTTAERIQDSARAMVEEEVVRISDDSLPGGDPVFIDIETDGLSPTITWLIGALDGSDAEDPAVDGTCQSFLATDPDEPGRAIADFMAWYTAEAEDRPLVAYNGWRFDFDVLGEHILEYCPRWAEEWERTDRFDPYRWAVDQGNAVLPGRTNKLDDVAAALGYDRAGGGAGDGTGLTGAATARTYRQWMADPSPAAEPDWDRFERYCADDVRGLATVYEALAGSSRIAANDDTARDVTDSTTQGTLSEW